MISGRAAFALRMRARRISRWLGHAALLALLVACGDGPPAPPRTARYAADGRLADPSIRPARRTHVLLVCLDTVRADAFAPWSATPTMPETSAWFARRGVAFRGCASAAPWTGPAVASLLTGLLPSHHGARELSDAFHLVPGVVTLAEILGGQGWTSEAITGGGWVSARNGMLQGFPRTVEAFSFQAARQDLLATLRAARARGPSFLFAHTYEAHDPYLAPPDHVGRVLPPPPVVDLAAIDREAQADGGRSLARRFLLDWRARGVVFQNAMGSPRIQAVTRYFDRGFARDPEREAFAAEARLAYEEGLRRLDGALAAFLREAEAAGLLDDALVVLTSDHGEAFGEGGKIHHGRSLHPILLRVPLFVAGPGWPAGRVVDASCSLLDVLPTVCDAMGLPLPEGLDGRSLRPLTQGGAGWPARAEERRTTAETGYPTDETLVGVRDARWSWRRTWDRATGEAREALFDLVADPHEERALADPAGADLGEAFLEARRAARTTR